MLLVELYLVPLRLLFLTPLLSYIPPDSGILTIILNLYYEDKFTL